MDCITHPRPVNFVDLVETLEGRSLPATFRNADVTEVHSRAFQRYGAAAAV